MSSPLPGDVLKVWKFPLWAPLLGLALFGICLAGVVRANSGRDRAIGAVGTIAFGLLLVDVTRRRLVLTQRGVTMISAWRGPRSIPFEQIVEIRPRMTLDVVGRDGTLLRVPDHLGSRDEIEAEITRECAERGNVL